ncbi:MULTISPECIES: septation ring formation regulator EzrA [Terrabacteria group]|uniref:septation ring formation regulator EzrA n=1 Tax=Bacillati TaxID=1783272 RepID=UPI001C6E2A7D|nr:MULTISPECIES: septation ring formation regulator EzrA [Terrabacteria group]MBW9211917.1 septation ring formation regulator EzrA [Trueperella sp. zg.1013]
MNQITSFISDIRFIIAVAVVVVLAFVWLIWAAIRGRHFQRELNELKVRFESVRMIPISLKMNKVINVANANEEIKPQVEEAGERFNKVTSAINNFEENLKIMDENIQTNHLNGMKKSIATLRDELQTLEVDIKEVEHSLDGFLAKETAQRQEVTALKNRFRAMKAQAMEIANRLSFAWPMVEQKLSDTEKMFSTFEEWMFNADFDKANKELFRIKISMQDLDRSLEQMPSLVHDGQGTIPKLAETLQKDYLHQRNRGVYLKHLEIETNLKAMTESLKENLRLLKSGSVDGVREHLDDMMTRIKQMDTAVKKEGKAFEEVNLLTKDSLSLRDEVEKTSAFVFDQYEKVSDRFGMEEMKSKLDTENEKFTKLVETMPSVIDTVKNQQTPATDVLNSLRKLMDDLNESYMSFKVMKEDLEAATGDEARAREQLMKLQVTMSIVQLKLRKAKLPVISEKYEEDVNLAYDYFHRMNDLLAEKPLKLDLINSTLQEAVPFVYKLFRELSNVLGTAQMVEDTIVYGNRYRSTYADIDSDLSCEELDYRNGEYTAALHKAISTMEKIVPGSYESMMKKSRALDA